MNPIIFQIIFPEGNDFQNFINSFGELQGNLYNAEGTLVSSVPFDQMSPSGGTITFPPVVPPINTGDECAFSISNTALTQLVMRSGIIVQLPDYLPTPPGDVSPQDAYLDGYNDIYFILNFSGIPNTINISAAVFESAINASVVNQPIFDNITINSCTVSIGANNTITLTGTLNADIIDYSWSFQITPSTNPMSWLLFDVVSKGNVTVPTDSLQDVFANELGGDPASYTAAVTEYIETFINQSGVLIPYSMVYAAQFTVVPNVTIDSQNGMTYPTLYSIEYGFLNDETECASKFTTDVNSINAIKVRPREERKFLYDIRDKLLINSPRGKQYIDTFYAHRKELLKIFILNRGILKKVDELVKIFRNEFAIEKISTASLSKETAEKVKNIMTEVSKVASDKLKTAIEANMNGIEDFIGKPAMDVLNKG